MSSNALSLSLFEAEGWREIARSAALMLTLCQRPSGFWAVPTNEKEVKWYFRDSTEIAFGDYDEGSYTITWYALLALEAIYGTCPSECLHDVQNVFDKHPPTRGAYGRLVSPGAQIDDRAIVESPRHTAFALLIRLRFLHAYRPEEWWQTVKWLLDARTDKHGWSYIRDRHGPDEAFATGACISALAYFLAVAEQRCDRNLVGDVRKALELGFKRLLEIRKDSESLWNGHLPHGDKDVPDSAKVIDLLRMPEIYGKLNEHVPHFVDDFAIIKHTLRAYVRPGGSPSSLCQGAPIRKSATVNVLPLAFEIFSRDDVEREFLRSLCVNVLKTFRGEGSRLRLESADWALLARGCAMVLASAGHGNFQEVEKTQINDYCHSLQIGDNFSVRMLKVAAYNMPTFSDGSIRYLLSKGSSDRGRWILALARFLFCRLPYAPRYLAKEVLKRIFGI